MVTRVSRSSTAEAARAGTAGRRRRHTGGPARPRTPDAGGTPDASAASAPSPGALADSPSGPVGPPSTADVRRLSGTLFRRLAELQEGTPEFARVRNSLVELNLNLVHYAAGRMRPRAESHEDVVQVGTIGLIKAIDRFELQRGVEFTSFALPTVIGEIKRFFRDTTWAVHVPRRLQELRIDLARATGELEQRHGRRPTTAELAAHMNLEPAEVAEGLAAANGYTAVSLDFPAESPDFDDSIAGHIGFQDPELALVDDLHTLKPLIASLSERERRILALRFVADMTQSEIGAEIGVTQMHVSRMLTRILTTLRTRIERPAPAERRALAERALAKRAAAERPAPDRAGAERRATTRRRPAQPAARRRTPAARTPAARTPATRATPPAPGASAAPTTPTAPTAPVFLAPTSADPATGRP